MTEETQGEAQQEASGVQQLTVAWLQRAHLVLDAHHTAAGMFEKRHYWLGIPTVALSTVVATAVFASLQNTPHIYMQIVVGLASILAAVLASLLTFLRYNERAEKHRLAGVRYGAIMRQLEQARQIPPHTEEEARGFFDSIRSRWDKLNEESPTMPTKTWDRLNRRHQKKKEEGQQEK